MNVSPEEMNYTVEKIAEMATWRYYSGFTAATCGNCHKTANVLAGSPGWFCPCGAFNVLPLHGVQIPHQSPDYGPSRDTISEGHERAHAGDSRAASVADTSHAPE